MDAAQPGTDAGATDCFQTRMFGQRCFANVNGSLLASMFVTDSSCTAVIPQPSGGPDVCAVVADAITISGLATATGSRALLLLAHQLTIESTGALEAIAMGGQPAAGAGTCLADSGNGDASGFGAGGGGGSFQSLGGIGGSNSTSAEGGGPSVARGRTVLAAGCAGGAGGSGKIANASGAGGAGGGAVYLAADAITIDGSVFAYGLGGDGGAAWGGGGGGGSGGMIVIDGQTVTIGSAALLLATGGGGGGGANSSVAGDPGSAPSAMAPAIGGAGGGAATYAGSGGQGSVDQTPAQSGFAGLANNGTGGGAGGGAGWIVVPADASNSGTIFPAAVPFP